MQRQILNEEITLPSGLVDKQKIRVPQMGHAADVFTSLAGDLLLTVCIKEHDFFKRVDMNVETEVPITLVEALKGSRITVQTVDGPLTIVTRAGICSGDTMNLKHFGFPEFNPPDGYDPETLRGDHIIKFKVLLPEYDPEGTSQQDQLLKKLLDLDKTNK